jgi:hypothetical protein
MACEGPREIKVAPKNTLMGMEQDYPPTKCLVGTKIMNMKKGQKNTKINLLKDVNHDTRLSILELILS